METSLEVKLDIFQSPAVFKNKDEIRKQWNMYLENRISKQKMPTRAGVCFALKIRRKEWNILKEHPKLGAAIDWIETVIEDTWLQELVVAGHSAGAIAYLKSHYPEQYRETSDDNNIIVHAIVGMQVIVEK